MTIRFSYDYSDIYPNDDGIKTYSISGNFNKTQVNSIVRFFVSDLTSRSLRKGEYDMVKRLVTEALDTGRSEAMEGCIVIEINKE